MKALLLALAAVLPCRAQVTDVPVDPSPVPVVPVAGAASQLQTLPSLPQGPLLKLEPLSSLPIKGRSLAATLRSGADTHGRPTSGLQAQEQDDRYLLSVTAASREQRTALNEAGLSIDEVNGDVVSGVAGRKALIRIQKMGLPIVKQRALSGLRPEEFPTEDAAFHTYDQTEAALAALAAARPDLVKTFSIGNSVKGRKLNGVRITSSKEPEGKLPAAFFMGSHHAREHLSTEVPLMVAQHLVQHADEPAVAALLASREIYVVPMVNPDGAELDTDGRRYHMWRKNARDNGDGSVGVDLNRNYGYGWGGGGASTDPSDETYRGPSAFSEPETQAVKAFIDAHPNIRTLLSYHTYSELILYPWGHSYDPVPDARDKAVFEKMAKTMAAWNGYKPEQSSDLYIASGDTTDWAYGEKKIFAFTFELTPKSWSGGGFYPGAKAIQSTFQANLKPALYLIEKAGDPYSVITEVTGGPVAPPSPSGR